MSDLDRLAAEIREIIVETVSRNTGHLASNLGVVELAIALHYCFDFLKHKLIWDVGHQVYPHKLLTGRRERFSTLRQKGGISGFPNRDESPYDTFTSGHAGTSISTALGIACGKNIVAHSRTGRPSTGEADDSAGADRQEETRAVAVIGDGAIAAGMAFEALNHAGELGTNLLVILNDNSLSISPTVGAFSGYLSRIRLDPFYYGLKKEVHNFLSSIPVFGRRMEKVVEFLKEAVKRGMMPGQIFEELGFSYFGPVDGHDIELLIETLREIEHVEGPLLLHVLTEKGKGFEPAAADPTRFHSPKLSDLSIVNGCMDAVPEEESASTRKSSEASSKGRGYTRVFSETLIELAKQDDRIVAITAAMPDGTGLSPFREEFPDRFFDVGICEQHALGLAAGLAESGLKPVAVIYSTFLQRAYDQIFHELCLQGLGVVLALDRAGLVGNDGPTHHGTFDIAYLRPLPGLTLMAPANAPDMKRMLKLAIDLDAPVAIRYPRTNCPEDFQIAHEPSTHFAIGESEILEVGGDGAIIAYGAMVEPSLAAALLLQEQDVHVSVINARFAKPLDTGMILKAVEQHPIVLTVEDHVLSGGFGSAVLEAVSSEKGERPACAVTADRSEEALDLPKIHRLGLPDRFVEHGAREQLLQDVGLGADGIAARFLTIQEAEIAPSIPLSEY